MKVTFSAPPKAPKGALAVFVMEGGKLSPSARALDKATGGRLADSLRSARKSGKADEFLVIEQPGENGPARLILVGVGEPGKLDALGVQRLGGKCQAFFNTLGEETVHVALDDLPRAKIKGASAAAEFAFGARLRAYNFDKYRTRKKEGQNGKLSRLDIQLRDAARARHEFEGFDKVADGVFLTRDLVSEPANILYPESLAKRAQELTRLGIKVEVLTLAQLRKLGMGALLGVAQGSAREPRVVVMQWPGGSRAKNAKPVAFIGKGVTFDTGGISIKPAQGMEDMKWDMGGAGVVIGLMKALAGRRARVNAVGVVGLVENMPDGNAQRPGDIVTSMSGQTIEVLNTDAEGRLVLADALWYTQDRFKPQAMVDLATLTGAILVALGEEYAGVFSNDEKLVRQLEKASKATGEKIWHMPLDEVYDKQIEGDAADIRNIGTGRWAGSITAAQFLQRFVNKVPWVHIDIAGTTWSRKDAPTVPRGGTGFGVRLLDRFVAEHYEK